MNLDAICTYLRVGQFSKVSCTPPYMYFICNFMLLAWKSDVRACPFTKKPVRSEKLDVRSEKWNYACPFKSDGKKREL